VASRIVAPSLLLAAALAACTASTASRPPGSAPSAGMSSAGPSADAAAEARLDARADDALRFAAGQYGRAATANDPARGYPRATQGDGAWKTVGTGDWTSGFFPGTLWLLYEHTRDPALRAQAERWTLPLAGIPRGRYDHDLGFQFMSSFGNAYRITGDERYRAPVLGAARLLAGRFDPRVGAIKSWDSRAEWPYRVIADNMMNLEMLWWAAAHGGDPAWAPLAVRHAETTLRNHVRPDGGSFHLVDFDTATGAVRQRRTVQGFADSSTWARGQAWLTYGYTMAYRQTRDTRFLAAARAVAGYALARLPADGIPCWDYQATGCPDAAPRDASAAAITASALLELAGYVPAGEAARYRGVAAHILSTLASPAYLARGSGKPSILLHSVGHKPANGEVDVGIVYADYYFVEALLRWKALRGHGAAGVFRAVDAGPPVHTRRGELLAEARARLRCGDPSLAPSYRALLADAEKALGQRPESVVEKTRIPPSGNRHDYVSLGPYWWPDSSKAGGIPYLRRDGERNPEASRDADVDAPRLDRMAGAVETLGLAWWFSGDERYAAHAARLLRAWFIDPATRMNPNLVYGQAIPGITEGRGIGIIETGRLIRVADALAMMDASTSLTADDRAGMRRWMGEYLDWLLASPNGLDEKAWYNNHGTWYDAQTAALALYLGRDTLAREIVAGTTRLRMATQIQPDGRQPEELARTRSFSYSAFNLEAFSELAEMGRQVGIDLWHYRPERGGTLRAALDYLAPYADPAVRWQGQQITAEGPAALALHLARARRVYTDARYGELLARIPPAEVAESRALLLYPAPSAEAGACAAPSAATAR